jgi:RNA-directed DNA polymerase
VKGRVLTGASSGFRLNNVNNYYNNSNVSSRNCKFLKVQTLPTVQKTNISNKGAGSENDGDFTEAKMKRINGIYERIISLDNLRLADIKACKGKSAQFGVIQHKKNQEANLLSLHNMLLNKTYKTSDYTTFKIFEPKEREIFRLPYFPDRILHHAILNELEPVFVSCFTADTYSCIKKRGIHKAARNVRKALNDEAGTKYCLKLDIKKFYPSVDHTVLKALLRRKFKDLDLLWLLDEIIESAEGLPIGNYLSQFLANYYLTWFDHWLKEAMQVKYYFRYADDIVILSDSKEELHGILSEIRIYLSVNLKLTVKDNYQVFPVDARGIDFVGYKFYHTHTLLRKSIKQRFARMIAKAPKIRSIVSYYGWAKHCNSKNLVNKLINQKSELWKS